MKLTLYYAPISCSLVPLVSLHEAGAEFEVKRVNLRKTEQLSPEFLRVNRKHKVPVLMIDSKPLTENVAMALWMTRAYPKAGILPADSETEVKAVSLMAWCASGIHPHLSRINSPAKFCDTPGSEESLKRLAAKELDYAYGIADDLLAGRDYFFDKWCAADSHFFWTWRMTVRFGLDFSKHRNCAAHFERMQRRPAVEKALDFEKQVQAEFAKSA